jgi:hypothetical protein
MDLWVLQNILIQLLNNLLPSLTNVTLLALIIISFKCRTEYGNNCASSSQLNWKIFVMCLIYLKTLKPCISMYTGIFKPSFNFIFTILILHFFVYLTTLSQLNSLYSNKWENNYEWTVLKDSDCGLGCDTTVLQANGVCIFMEECCVRNQFGYNTCAGWWKVVTQTHGRGRGEAQTNRKTTLFRITILFFITNISICL